jgi:hypothetical protein
VRQAQDRRIKALQDSVRKAGSSADSQFSSAHGHQVPAGKALLQDSVRLTRIDQANSVAVHIQPARRVPVDIRRAREWVEQLVQADHPRPRADLRVRAAQRAVLASLLFREKKKAQ